jgi:hypothetical protein
VDESSRLKDTVGKRRRISFRWGDNSFTIKKIV